MPQLRSFSSFAGTPNIGSTMIGAAGVGQRAREAAMQAQNERERINSQMAIAQMEANTRANQLNQQAQMQAQELDVRKQMLQQQVLKEQQEIELQKAYQEAQLGIRERDIGLQERQFANEISQAADASKARLSMQRDVEELIAAGESPSVALQHAIARHGAGAQLPGGAIAAVARGGEGAGEMDGSGGFDMGQMYDVPGQEGWRFGRTGPKSGQYFPPEKAATIPQDVAFDPALVKEGTRYFTKPAEKQAQQLEKDRREIRNKLNSKEFNLHRLSLTKASDPNAKLTIGDKSRIEEYRKQEEELAKIENRIAELRSSLTNSVSLPRGTNAAALRILNIRRRD